MTADQIIVMDEIPGDWASVDGPQCEARRAGFACTARREHYGPHAAYGTHEHGRFGTLRAVWYDESAGISENARGAYRHVHRECGPDCCITGDECPRLVAAADLEVITRTEGSWRFGYIGNVFAVAWVS